MKIDKKLLEQQIKILALQLNKKISTKERDAFEGLLNMLGDIADGAAVENTELKALQKEFEQYKKESIKWSINDFLDLEGIHLTKKQAQKALELMIRKHDANNGITYETLKYFAGEIKG